jgi:hypothetical protein
LPSDTLSTAPILPIVPTVPDFVLAADSLDKYVRDGGLDRSRVSGLQRRIGGIAADGIPGPKTYAKCSEILKRTLTWPHLEAAHSLRAFVRANGKDKMKIGGYQTQMGELEPDGIVGPKTRSRYQTLTGKAW